MSTNEALEPPTLASRPDAGTISFPILGEIRVKGLTAGAVEDHITRGLKGRYLVNPQVTVSRLLGANKAYVEQRLPHLSRLLTSSAEIAAGSSDGIQVNDPVVNQNGLIGNVTSVTPGTAQVTAEVLNGSGRSRLARLGDRLIYIGGLPTAETFALPLLQAGSPSWVAFAPEILDDAQRAFDSRVVGDVLALQGRIRERGVQVPGKDIAAVSRHDLHLAATPAECADPAAR